MGNNFTLLFIGEVVVLSGDRNIYHRTVFEEPNVWGILQIIKQSANLRKKTLADAREAK